MPHRPATEIVAPWSGTPPDVTRPTTTVDSSRRASATEWSNSGHLRRPARAARAGADTMSGHGDLAGWRLPGRRRRRSRLHSVRARAPRALAAGPASGGTWTSAASRFVYIRPTTPDLPMPARRSLPRAGPPPHASLARARSDEDSAAADAPHGSRPEQVYQRLRDLIVQGLLAPGSRVVETEVADAARREPHAGARGAAAAPAGRLRRRRAGRAAGAADRRAAHARRRARAAQHRRRARRAGRALGCGARAGRAHARWRRSCAR